MTFRELPITAQFEWNGSIWTKLSHDNPCFGMQAGGEVLKNDDKYPKTLSFVLAETEVRPICEDQIEILNQEDSLRCYDKGYDFHIKQFMDHLQNHKIPNRD